MAFIDKYGVEFSDDGKTLIQATKELSGHYVIPEGVERIEEYAFGQYGCFNAVTIPSSVKEIGDDAFPEIGVTDIYISDIIAWCNISFGCDSAHPFGWDVEYGKPDDQPDRHIYLNDKKIIDLVIPEGATRVANFKGCNHIESVVIPDGVAEIGYAAFGMCLRLRSVVMSNSVKSIDTWAFSNCPDLKSIRLSSNIETIPWACFTGCEKLNDIIIPEGVKRIEGFAFENCPISSITIPESLTEIEYQAFNIDHEFEKVIIKGYRPEFEDKLNEVYCTVREIIIDGQLDLSKLEFSEDGKTLIDTSNVVLGEEFTIPNGVEYIEDEAFRGQDHLHSVIIPEGIKGLGNEVFRNCDALWKVTIPDTLEDIGEDVFYGCDYINQPVYNKRLFIYMPHFIKGVYAIPDGIENVWANFADCEITELTIPQSVQDIQYGAFRDCSDLTVTIPKRFKEDAEVLGLNECKKVIYY